MEGVARILERIVEKIPISLSIPISPDSLNYQLQAAAHLLRFGDYRVIIPTYRLVFLVPAGGVVEIPFELPPNMLCTRRYPIRFESDHYSKDITCLLYTSPSPRDLSTSRMPSSA